MTQETPGSERTFADAALPPNAARWIAEAERLNRRYQTEIVEAHVLCPWAARARLDQAFHAQVLLQADASVEATLQAIDALSVDLKTEAAVLIYPRLTIGRADFERFVARIRHADTPRHPLGGVPFVLAAFHPDAEPDVSDADRLIPFLRRTPDPTIQLLRTTVLDRVREGTPQGTQFFDMLTFNAAEPFHTPLPLRDRIARANLATVDRVGVEELRRRLDAILHDRIRTYRELAAATEPAEALDP